MRDERKYCTMSGRRAEAARNDGLILEAAREVFVADPGADLRGRRARRGRHWCPVPPLREQGGSLEAALCRRTADLHRRREEALADEGDPWKAFAGFMRRIVDADTPSLTLRLAGTFTPTEELYRDSQRAQELNVRLFERTRAAGAIRPDVEVDDIALLFEQLAAVRVGDESAPDSFATGTWRCSSTPSTLRRSPSYPARHRAGRRSTSVGRRSPLP